MAKLRTALPAVGMVAALGVAPFALEWALPSQSIAADERLEIERTFADLGLHEEEPIQGNRSDRPGPSEEPEVDRIFELEGDES